MDKVLEVIVFLLGVIGEASAALNEYAKLVNKARAEGRDITDAELDAVKARRLQKVQTALDKLRAAQSK